MAVLSIFLIAISLSMDAFSLAICYGMLDINKEKKYLLSSVVGLYHFIMPELGMFFGHFIKPFIWLDIKYIVFIIFLLLGIEMMLSIKKDNKKTILLNKTGLLIFGFIVSIDSFSAGIGIEFINDRHLLCSFIFSITSFLFTFLGLNIGSKINIKLNKIAPLIGGVLFILLAIFYLFNL